MTRPDTITRRLAYCARPLSLDDQIRAQADSEMLAEAKGMTAEASRSRVRRQALEAKRARQASGGVKRAKRRAGNRDPLSRVPDVLRRAGEALRDHAEGAVIGVDSAGVSVELIDCGSSADMEGLTDRRRRGEAAWRQAMGAITRERFRDPIRKVIVYQLPLIKATELAVGHKGGKAQAQAKESLIQALESAAAFFGMVEHEPIDGGRELAY